MLKLLTLFQITVFSILFIPNMVAQHNSLTFEETGEGWILLFDGRTMEEWQQTGANYAMHPADESTKKLMPVGQFNSSRIRVDHGHVTHWLEDAKPNTIDWQQFIGQAPWHDFSLERFFRWRCWWEYSTGLSGDLLTHEYDAMNQILSLGIPHSAISSGGIYFFKDGRTVPDVLHTVFEYPERDLTLMYSATLMGAKQAATSTRHSTKP